MEEPVLDFTINGARNMEIRNGLHGLFAEQYKKLLNGGTVHTILTEYGDMLFQQLKTSFGSVNLSMYNMVHEAELSAESQTSAVEFMFMMEGEARFKMEGLKNISLGQKDCHLIYYPFISNKVTLPAGSKITMVDLHLDPDFLQRISPYFREVGTFLEKVEKKEATVLRMSPISIPKEVLSIIATIFTKKEILREQMVYLERKAMDWIISPIEMPLSSQRDRIRLTTVEENRIIEVFDYMLSHIDTPLTIQKLAQMAMMNEYTFKYGFKSVFHQSPHQALMAERIKKAQQLLEDPELTMTDIATLLGYESLSAFSNAFKDKIGFAPSVFREGRDKRS